MVCEPCLATLYTPLKGMVTFLCQMELDDYPPVQGCDSVLVQLCAASLISSVTTRNWLITQSSCCCCSLKVSIALKKIAESLSIEL